MKQSDDQLRHISSDALASAGLRRSGQAWTCANSRRLFLKTCCSSFMIIVGVSSCETKEKNATTIDPCLDYSELSDEDLAKRKSLGYVDKAPTENKHCGNCNLWLPPKEADECGRCQLFKGPVPSEAYCTYWAPQV